MPENLKQKWKQASAEAALEKSEAEYQATEAELLAAYDDDLQAAESNAKDKSVDKSIDDEWNHLKRIAMAKFPEGARILGLTPKNRLVAIAHCLGWPNTKISKASGLNVGTVSKWLNQRPDVKLFIDEYNFRNGVGNTDILKESLSELEYLAIQTAKNILKDKDTSEGMKRLKLDASKWVFNLTRDKAEDGSVGLKEFLAQLHKAAAQTTALTPEEEKELFDVN